MVERIRGRYLVRRSAEVGNEPDPRDVEIARLKQQIQELERRREVTRSKRIWETLDGENLIFFVHDQWNHHVGDRKEPLCSLRKQVVSPSECVGKVHPNYHGSLCSLGRRVSIPKFVGKVPQYYPLETEETESKPIVWDIGEEEEEHPFVDNYEFFENDEDSRTSLFQEGEKGGYEDNLIWDILVEEDMLVQEESFPVYDTDNEEKENIIEEESDPIYDTDTDEEDKYKDEEFLYGDRVMIQSLSGINLPNIIYQDSYGLIRLEKDDMIEMSKYSLVSFLISENYLVGNMASTHKVTKLGMKTIKTRGRVFYKKGNLMQGVQVWMLKVKGKVKLKQDSRSSLSQEGENDAVLK